MHSQNFNQVSILTQEHVYILSINNKMRRDTLPIAQLMVLHNGQKYGYSIKFALTRFCDSVETLDLGD